MDGLTTSVMIPNKTEHIELKHKAALLNMNLSDLFWEGALAYKPKKGKLVGMDKYLDKKIVLLPKNPLDMDEWRAYAKYSDDNKQVLRKLILSLDHLNQEIK